MGEPGPGTMLQGRYRMDGPLGTGGMGAVYRVWDVRLEAPRALKEMRRTGGSESENVDALARFKQEALILSRLQHPGLPRVQDFFEEGGRHYLVMDQVEGQDLEAYLGTHLERCRGGGLPEALVLEFAMQILDILGFLHGQDPPIIHRDLKPSNVVRRYSDGRLVLVDFGTARITGPGVVTSIGTAGYAPPEQYRGETECRSDLYSLGATLHHLLTGRAPEVPFEFPALEQVRPDLGPLLVEGVHRALRRLPGERFASAGEMKQFLAGPRPSRSSGRVPASGPDMGSPAVAFAVAPAVASAVVEVASVSPSRASRRPAGPVSLRSQGELLKWMGLAFLRCNTTGCEEYRCLRDGSVLVLVQGGTFTMGSMEYRDERPPHSVTLAPYLLGKHPVTNQQVDAFVRDSKYRAERDWHRHARDGNAPAAGVSWRDAVAYCDWAGLRLPSEPEWEFAARGLEGREFPWGDAWDPQRLAWAGNWQGHPVAVGSQPRGASPCGCRDMAGNVWEWCSSKYRPYPYDSEDGREDRGSNDERVLRGGSCYSNVPADFRGASRHRDFPDGEVALRGLRGAMSLPPALLEDDPSQH